jgi:hypothetical protein
MARVAPVPRAIIFVTASGSNSLADGASSTALGSGGGSNDA